MQKTAELLAEAFRKFEIDDECAVAVLYGKGDTFCAGYDLEELSQRGPDEYLKSIAPPGEGDAPMVRYFALFIFEKKARKINVCHNFN